MKLVWATVTQCNTSQNGAYECAVLLDDGSTGQAIAYYRLLGTLAVGDRVLLNTTAVDLALGTGGKHFVVTRVDADTVPSGVALEQQSGGHLMKLRYTPLQCDVLACEAPESPFHTTMSRVTSLENIPVVCCGLHSQVPIVAATIKAHAPHLRIVYVMTDQAALALELSGIIAGSVERGIIDATVSCGQAFGGQFEAINLHSGLLAACHLGAADVIIVGIGPGVAGTSTPFGHGGVAQGEAINAAASLQGRPIACLRMSSGDKRERHQGLSHHTRCALETVALASAMMPLPYIDDKHFEQKVEQQLESLSNNAGHRAFQFDHKIFDSSSLQGLHVTTMGRDFTQDALFFEAAAAAGTVALMMAQEEPNSSGCVTNV